MNKIFDLMKLFFAFLLVICLSACGSGETGPVSIQVDQESIESDFLMGDFSLADIKLILTMDDGTTETMHADASMVSQDDLNRLEEPGKHVITVIYEGLSATFTVSIVSEKDPLTETLMSIYELAVETEAFDGTYEEWLETVRGPKGEDGREVEFHTENNNLKWRYIGETDWEHLFDFNTLDQGDFFSVALVSPEGHLLGMKIVREGSDVQFESLNIPKGYEIKDLDRIENVTEDMILETELVPKEYTIYLESEHPINTDSVKVAYRQEIPEIVLETEVHEGRYFQGWYLDAYLTEPFEYGTMPSKDFTLYAKWGGLVGEFPEDDIEIVMWHAFGNNNQNLINEMLGDFLADHPNITMRQVNQGRYDDLRSATIQSIVAGSTPTLVMGYPDHFVKYVEGNALIPLGSYINHDTFGVDIDDYNDAFIEENQQYLDGLQYSMPFAKSTEILYYNKDFFDHHGISFDLDDPITWEQLEQFEEDGLIGTGEWQVPHLFSVDSQSNLFINSSTQWEAGYTNIDGEILIDNDQTRDMLNYFADLMDRNILALPIEWDTAYGSAAFIDGDVAMTQGSTAGTRYNIPNNPDGKFGVFEFGVMPAIQREDGPRSTIQQGPNIAIMANSTPDERLVAWEIIKELTSTENTAFFSMNTGYVPVRDSAYDLQEYQNFLAIADDPNNANDRAYPYALANRVAKAQSDHFSFEPPFTGRVTSSIARSEVGFLIEKIYTGTDVETALQHALSYLHD